MAYSFFAKKDRALSVDGTNPTIGTDKIIQFVQNSCVTHTSFTIIGDYYERNPLSRGLQGRDRTRF
jgi:hypothetical protein